jgi:hypothetical protein
VRLPGRDRRRRSRVLSFLFSYFVQIHFISLLILFFTDSFFLRWLPLSFSPLCCLLPARVVARSLRARAGQRTTRRYPHCWPCKRARITPPASRHSRRGRCHSLCCCVPAARARQAGVRPAAAPAYLCPIPSPSQLALCPRASRPPLMVRLLSVTLPCRPSPLFLSGYKSDPKPPLTPPTPPQHLSSSTSRCSSPPLLTIATHHPLPWTALRRPSLHEVRAGIGPSRSPLYFLPLPGCCHVPGGRRPWPSRPPSYRSPPPPVLS